MSPFHVIHQIISAIKSRIPSPGPTSAIWLIAEKYGAGIGLGTGSAIRRSVDNTFVPYLVAFGGKSFCTSTVVNCASVRALMFVFVFTGGTRLALFV
jgi:hypothetical protein